MCDGILLKLMSVDLFTKVFCTTDAFIEEFFFVNIRKTMKVANCLNLPNYCWIRDLFKTLMVKSAVFGGPALYWRL